MKTARRQELHSNELAQQIEAITTAVRTHGRQAGGIVIVVAAALIGAYVYYQGRQSDLQQGWADLYDLRAVSGVPVSDQISHYRRIADRNLDPLLTATALMRIGELALAESLNPSNSQATREDWLRQADESFRRVTKDFGQVDVSASAAELSLGVVAENRHDFSTARGIYQKIVGDTRFASPPIVEQAKYRLAHLDEWMPAVEFPPPLPTTSTAPANAAAGANPPPPGLAPIGGMKPIVGTNPKAGGS